MEDSYLKTFELDLPAEASFFHRSENNLFPAEYGPRIFTHPAFECVWPSADVVIVGDVATNQYRLFGADIPRSTILPNAVCRDRWKNCCIPWEKSATLWNCHHMMLRCLLKKLKS